MPESRFERTATMAALALAAMWSGVAQVQAEPGKSDKPTGYRTDAAGGAPAVNDKSSWDPIADSFGGYRSETRPCKDSTMQFTLPTEVRVVNVRAGQSVKKGEVLVRARDGELKAAVDQQRLLAASTLDIEARERQMNLAKFRFDRLRSSKNYSPAEFEEASTAYETGRIQYEAMKLDHETQIHKLKQLEGQFERSFLEAPFDGIIEEVFVEVGQGINEQQKALRIVDVSRLWLDAYVDTGETIERGLQSGSKAWVLVGLPKPVMVEAKVLNLSPVADSVSQTRRVRVEIENSRNWPAGVPARLRFSEPEAKFAQYKISAGVARVDNVVVPGEAVEERIDCVRERRSVEPGLWYLLLHPQGEAYQSVAEVVSK